MLEHYILIHFVYIYTVTNAIGKLDVHLSYASLKVKVCLFFPPLLTLLSQEVLVSPEAGAVT